MDLLLKRQYGLGDSGLGFEAFGFLFTCKVETMGP